MLERIGNCRIVEEIASGGMAVVYRAVQDPLGRTVAIKALKTIAAAEENVITRFEREARVSRTCSTRTSSTSTTSIKERGAMYIVMEYVQGIDLYDLLEKCGRLPYDVAAIIAMQVARALDYVHYRGIVHRDIKPANIMIVAHRRREGHGLRHRARHQLRRPHRGGHRHRHPGLHVSRAGARRQARRAQRHLLARRRAVPDGHGQEAVRRGREAVRDAQDPAREARQRAQHQSRDSARARRTSSTSASRSSRAIAGAARST